MSASFVKINKFVLNLAQKVFNLGSDTLKVALTNTLPVAATANQLSDITQITASNGYSSGGASVSITSSTQTSGTYKLVIGNALFTATGAVGPFEWAVLYDSTASNSELIGFWDYGSAITLANGDTFTVVFDATNGVLTIA